MPKKRGKKRKKSKGQSTAEECPDAWQSYREEKESRFFGSYACHCGKQWVSERAVQGRAMRCKKCGNDVLPEPKRRGYLGEYKCPECWKRWMSVKSEPGCSQNCKKCDIEVKPHKLTPLDEPSSKLRRVRESSEELEYDDHRDRRHYSRERKRRDVTRDRNYE